MRTLGRPEVEITEFGDGQPLKFTAEVDVRPEITLPDLGDDRGHGRRGRRSATRTSTTSSTGLRQRFADAEDGGAAGRSAATSCRSTWPPRSTARRCQGGTASNLSHEVGSNQLLPGLDDALVGHGAPASRRRSPRSWSAGDFAGRDAEVAVTVRTVKEQRAAGRRRRLRPAGERVRHPGRAAGRPVRRGSAG